MREARGRRVLKVLVAAGSLAALGGCFHVPARAIANGRQLGYETSTQVIYGDHNPAAYRQMYNALQSSAFGYQYDYRPYVPRFRR